MQSLCEIKACVCHVDALRFLELTNSNNLLLAGEAKHGFGCESESYIKSVHEQKQMQINFGRLPWKC